MSLSIQFIHILLSTLTFAVLSLAAIQALLLAVQENLLRHKQTNKFLNMLPAMELMEAFLFRIILLGFLLLTAVLTTSFLSFYPLLIPILWEKTLLSLFAWFVFLSLLLGRYYFGWRGKVAIRWTLSGVFFVTLIYFGAVFLN